MVAGARALAELDRMGMRLGPVVATPTRWSLLVAPYTLERLGELLHAQDWVPSSLRFHGEGGYLVLPPSETGAGQVRWERAPERVSRPDADGGAPVRAASSRAVASPWLPDVGALLDALVEASNSAPDGGRPARVLRRGVRGAGCGARAAGCRVVAPLHVLLRPLLLCPLLRPPSLPSAVGSLAYHFRVR